MIYLFRDHEVNILIDGMSTRTKEILAEIIEGLSETASEASDILDSFIFSCGSASIMGRNLRRKMTEKQFRGSMQSLVRYGYIKKVNEDQFLITPKGRRKALFSAVERFVFKKKDWKGDWSVVIFDIPEDKSDKRDVFRATLLRIGFIGIQKSVYIAPFADFKMLACLRDNLGISRYVTLLISRVANEDDDSELRKRFGLKRILNS